MSTLKVNNLQDLGADAVVTNGVIDPGAITSLNASALPTGSIVQVVHATYATATTTSSSSYQYSGLEATITPTSASNKIIALFSAEVKMGGNGRPSTITMFRGTVASGTDLAPASFGLGYAYSTTSVLAVTVGFNYIDSPATTSATTYQIGFKDYDGAANTTIFMDGVPGSLILMEVAA